MSQRFASDNRLALRQGLIEGLFDTRPIAHGQQGLPGAPPLFKQRMPRVSQLLIAGPEKGPEYRPEESIAGLLLDDESRFAYQLGKVLTGKDIDMVRLLEIHLWSDRLLNRLASDVGYAEQIEGAGLAHANQLCQEVCWAVDMLHHFHRHHFIEVVVRQRQGAGVTDEGVDPTCCRTPQALLRLANLIRVHIDKRHLSALVGAEMDKIAVTAADVQHMVLGCHRETAEELSRFLVEPAAEVSVAEGEVRGWGGIYGVWHRFDNSADVCCCRGGRLGSHFLRSRQHAFQGGEHDSLLLGGITGVANVEDAGPE